MPELRTRGVELRAADSGDGYTLTGYASVFETPYPVTDSLGEYTETIRSGAFTKALQERDDVRLLLNHDGVPLARTKSGTLTLTQDEIGLRCEAALDSASPLVASIKSAMDRGDMDQMSFAFQAVRQEWNADYTSRTITEAKLFDVSVVTYPASPTTSAHLRSASDEDANPRAAALCERAAREFRAGNAIEGDVRDLLLQALGAIDAGTEIVEDAADVIEAALGLSSFADPDDMTEAEPVAMNSASTLLALRAAALDL